MGKLGKIIPNHSQMPRIKYSKSLGFDISTFPTIHKENQFFNGKVYINIDVLRVS